MTTVAPAPTTHSELEVSDGSLLLTLLGSDSKRIRDMEKVLGVQVGVRGQVLHMRGAEREVEHAQNAVSQILAVMQSGTAFSDTELLSAMALLVREPGLNLREVMKPVSLGKSHRIAPRGLAQRHYVQAIQNHDIVFGVGPAGTGKTYLAMAMAVASLLEHRVKRIVLTRPAVEAGEKLGFLPGDMTEKVDPYLRPLYDALYDMMPLEKAQALIARGTIEVAPLAFMRGRTLNDSFVILDEAQNTKTTQMRMFLTRVGQRSKAVITGDATQVDLPGGITSGLSDAVHLLRDIDGIQVCHFSAADVVRHRLVQKIVEAYDARDEAIERAAWGRSRRPTSPLQLEPDEPSSTESS